MTAMRAQISDSPAFSGFGPQALPFFKALAFHQDRSWFEANRAIHESDVRAPLAALIEALSAELAHLGVPLKGDARSIFRLHRDVRFAKDKRPYKTNSGAVLTRDGTKKSPGLLYIHVDPDGCFAAAGFWQPAPDQLGAIRRAIMGRPGEFRAVAASLRASGLLFGDGDPTSRLPKGFEQVADPDLAAAIRMRSFVVRRPIDADVLRSPGLVERIVDFARDAEPLLRFGWAALDAAATG